jgi:CTP-dependent riboflavin kinase
MVKVKADETALKMGINFKRSNRWMQHLKEKGNITWHSVSEGAVADLGWAQKRQENVKPFVTKYALKDIFNLNEMALFSMHNQREFQR